MDTPPTHTARSSPVKERLFRSRAGDINTASHARKEFRCHGNRNTPQDHCGEKGSNVTATVTARDVPEIRARITAWTRDTGNDGAANWFRFFLGPTPHGASKSRVFDHGDDVAAIIFGTLAAQFPAAELFYVSDRMTELARHAADKLTDYRLHPEDLPAPIGLMVYAQPPVPAYGESTRNDAITMVSWGPGRGGLWMHTWAAVAESWALGGARLGQTLACLPHDEALDRAAHAAARLMPDATPGDPPTVGQATDRVLAGLLPNLRRAPIPPSVSPPHGWDWRGLTPMEFTGINGWPTGVHTGEDYHDSVESTVALERAILATWLLMGQTLTRAETQDAPRAARRRIARNDPDLGTGVRFIDLRRSRTAHRDDTTGDHGNGTRHYNVSWWVRGHWRNQFYPSRNDHRPVWIEEHPAGPPDKPLKGGEKVNVLRR